MFFGLVVISSRVAYERGFTCPFSNVLTRKILFFGLVVISSRVAYERGFTCPFSNVLTRKILFFGLVVISSRVTYERWLHMQEGLRVLVFCKAYKCRDM